MKIIAFFLVGIVKAYALSAINTPYLIQILLENVKRYEQLREVIRHGENTEELLRVLNEGINNASGLLESLPIDNKDLESLAHYQDSLRDIEKNYGSIPKGKEAPLFHRHDKTASEGIEMAKSSKGYAKRQEHNAESVFQQAPRASMVGAQRMTAQTSAQILHVLNQLLRVNSQILKMQSERFAGETKEGKDSTRHFNRFNKDLEQAFKKFEISKKFPRIR